LNNGNIVLWHLHNQWTLYFDITCFKGSNMFIHQVFTFCEIFNPPIFTNLASLVNSKCRLKELEKLKYNEYNKSLNLATVGKFDKTWTKFVLSTMQCCPSKHYVFTFFKFCSHMVGKIRSICLVCQFSTCNYANSKPNQSACMTQS
jgi:hypothetical protein